MKVLVATEKPFAAAAVEAIRKEVEAAGNELVLLEKYTEKKQLLEAVADVDAIINKKFASWQEKQDRAIADAVAKVEEAHKLAQMNDKEKADHERKQMEDELALLKAEKAHGEMMKQARGMFKADGLDMPDEVISALVTDNADTTRDAVKAFSGWALSFVQSEVKRQLAGAEPKKGGASGLTREEIMAIKDTKQRLKAIEENIDLVKTK